MVTVILVLLAIMLVLACPILKIHLDGVIFEAVLKLMERALERI
jgi:Tfp pilus assembly protein FimT